MKLFGLAVASFLSSGGRNADRIKTTCSLNAVPPALAHEVDLPSVYTTSFDIEKVAVSDMQRISSTVIPSRAVNDGIHSWLSLSSSTVTVSQEPSAAAPPSKDEIKLLQNAFAVFYGMDRDYAKAETLLSQAIDAWQRQPADEQAGLYRVRGDCYMALLRPADAAKDYSDAIRLIQSPGGDEADPAELPAAYLGRARAIRSQAKPSKEQLTQAAKDYQLSLRLSSREDWDTDLENEEDGALRNPYAAWEWGSTLRQLGDYQEAYRVHKLAADSFDDIGDRIHSIVSEMDAGIDLAATGKLAETRIVIENAIKREKSIDSGDVKFLQVLLSKEGESRIALASLLWDAGEKQEAEEKFGTACLRLDQLSIQAQKMIDSKKVAPEPARLKFSIDDGAGPLEVSCSRFKSEAFLTDTLQWPEPLQKKVMKLEKLQS